MSPFAVRSITSCKSAAVGENVNSSKGALQEKLRSRSGRGFAYALIGSVYGLSLVVEILAWIQPVQLQIRGTQLTILCGTSALIDTKLAYLSLQQIEIVEFPSIVEIKPTPFSYYQVTKYFSSFGSALSVVLYLFVVLSIQSFLRKVPSRVLLN